MRLVPAGILLYVGIAENFIFGNLEEITFFVTLYIGSLPNIAFVTALGVEEVDAGSIGIAPNICQIAPTSYIELTLTLAYKFNDALLLDSLEEGLLRVVFFWHQGGKVSAVTHSVDQRKGLFGVAAIIFVGSLGIHQKDIG